jgi:hypothetical protein
MTDDLNRTADLHLTATLPTALHTMADSDQPPVMDVEHVLHEGRRSLLRRRVAALGGGTAILALSALLVGTLAGAGSGVQGGEADSAAAATFTVDPHDPVLTHYQFTYIPPGMVAYGGYEPDEIQMSTTLVTENSGFALELLPWWGPVPYKGAKGESAPTEKVSVTVPGTATAYWLGYGKGRITLSNGNRTGGQMAFLALQLKSGKWLELNANNIQERKDWKEQVLKAAAGLVEKDRSLPMPFQLAGALPPSFKFWGGTVMHRNGVTSSSLTYDLGPDKDNKIMEDLVSIGADTATGATGPALSNPSDTSVCKDSEGLTLCVTYPKAEPAALKAIGGPQALLNRVTSLGNDPANWTTDVIH